MPLPAPQLLRRPSTSIRSPAGHLSLPFTHSHPPSPSNANPMTPRSDHHPIPFLLLFLILIFPNVPFSAPTATPHWRKAGDHHHHRDGLHPTVLIPAPAMLLLFFAALCSCFRPKPRPISEQQQASPEEIPSKQRKLDHHEFKIGGGSSSFEANRWPWRTQGSSVGTMPNQLRPASPGRFSPSPRTSCAGSVQLQPTLNQIAKATQNFSQSCVMGTGVDGVVYKAELPDGQVVAVKRATEKNVAAPRNEFRNEAKLLSQIEHKNLVKLLGYIDEGSEQIIISEYVPNGTLRGHLDGYGGKFLNFSQRLNIAIDVAHGLTYLHQYAEKTIIHRDVKSSNILLTEALSAKVADFGFARASTTDHSGVVTNIQGTAGYTDPHYMVTGVLSRKSDVFSYGVLLLEILSGRRPLEAGRSKEEKVTVRWAFGEYTNGRIREILDPHMEEQVKGEVISKLLGLAFECAAPVPRDRPSMEEVVKMLWNMRNEYTKSRSG